MTHLCLHILSLCPESLPRGHGYFKFLSGNPDVSAHPSSIRTLVLPLQMVSPSCFLARLAILGVEEDVICPATGTEVRRIPVGSRFLCRRLSLSLTFVAPQVSEASIFCCSGLPGACAQESVPGDCNPPPLQQHSGNAAVGPGEGCHAGLTQHPPAPAFASLSPGCDPHESPPGVILLPWNRETNGAEFG